MTASAPARTLFVNLAVKDVQRSMAFFDALGFVFDPRFCSEQAACVILNAQAYVMLLAEARFRDFTRRELCDTTRQTEGLFALSATSREEVDRLVRTALEHGGTPAHTPVDHGVMYGWSFYDPDGHHWEVIWMDPAAVPPAPAPAEPPTS